MFRRLRFFTTRILFGNILVAVLTSVIGVLLLALVLVISMRNVQPADYAYLAKIGGMEWLFGVPDGLPNTLGYPPGFTLVIAPDKTVLFSQGDSPCKAGQQLADCAPNLKDLTPSERFYDQTNERWAEAVITTTQGQTVITRRGQISPELTLALPGLPIYGTVPFMIFVSTAMAILSVPVSLVLTWQITRPMRRRLISLVKTSRHFAEGDFKARVNDHNHDEIGELAQQFDDMANTLEQNFSVLRDLVQRNAELSRKAEESAIRAERNRISRELHDAIAQRLFSLSVSTSTLPDLIQRNQEQGAAQARTIATLAEQTLLDLRSLLVELRPTSIVQRGLTDAIKELCDEWQTNHHVPVECMVMIGGKYISAGVEDIVYRVAQEALSNAVKHAEASAIHVSLVRGQRQLTLSVTDNGTGFDPEQAAANGKFGLMSMQERARSVGGTLSIESDTTQGTTVRMVIPLEKDMAHDDARN